MAERPAPGEEELERLAVLIADSLLRAKAADATHSPGQGSDVWLRPPVRPDPPARGGDPPVWSGAAQSIEGIARSSGLSSPAGRSVPIGELSNATRAAAAGRGTAPSTAAKGRAARASAP